MDVPNYPPAPAATDVKVVASALATPSKKLGSEPICDIWVRAFLRCGHNAAAASALLGMTPQQFSKDFSRNWPDNAATLKRLDKLPFEVRREFFALGAAECGLQVGIDWEDRTILRRFAQLLRDAA